MSRLGTDPAVMRIARRLGLPNQGDCLPRIQDHALAQIKRMVSDFPVRTLNELLMLVAARLSVQLEWIRSDEDLDRLINFYQPHLPTFRGVLREEFINQDTEGLLLRNPCREPGARKYIAIIDARGERASRAYFTAWHELTHMLVTPPPEVFSGVRRSPSEAKKKRDPEEALVDRVASRLAFYEPLFAPALQHARSEEGAFNFKAIERARETVAPDASLYATALASLRIISKPACLVQVDLGLKEEERRRSQSGQLDLPLGFEPIEPEPMLRVVQISSNQRAMTSPIRIFRNMRVPPKSVLHQAYDAMYSGDWEAIENQGWWETSQEGPLPSLPLHISAVRRGSYVYGLIVAMVR